LATYMFDMGGVDIKKALDYIKNNPDEMRFPKLDKNSDIEKLSNRVFGVAGYYKQVEAAKNNGEYNVPGDLVFYISRPIKGQVSFNTTHIGNINGTNADDLTRAEIEGRKQMMEVVNFAVKYLPGFENAYLLKSAVQVGIRETRRIIGEYKFSEDDVANARKFDDAIARLAYYVDIHCGSGKGYTKSEEKKKLIGPPDGDWYEIPFRCLMPKKLINVLMAGRCISSTQGGHGAIRIMPACCAMGQAAGTAAAISIKYKIKISDINFIKIKQTLARDGAIV
ncbi:MAG: FAD-dependent oxidoreductase, partial [Armatimonadota bacterium]